MFDWSDIACWKAINESYMGFQPDLTTAVMEPFFAQPTLAITCDIIEPSTGQPYERDPRSTSKAALKYMQSLGSGDTAYFGPEAEFFVFDDVKYDVKGNKGYYELDDGEGTYNTAQIGRASCRERVCQYA